MLLGDLRGRLRQIRAQKVQERAPTAPPVVVLELKPLQEHEDAEQVGVAQDGHSGLGLQTFTQSFHSGLQAIQKERRVGIRRLRFIDQTAFERSIGANQGRDRLTRVEIHGAAFFHGAAEGEGQGKNHGLMLLNELFRQADVAIGDVRFADGRNRLAEAGLAQMRAIGRTIDGDFPLLAAALRANFAAYARTVPARAPLFAQFAGDIHECGIASKKESKPPAPFHSYPSIGSSTHRVLKGDGVDPRGASYGLCDASYDQSMRRTDLYVKVELVHDDEEKAERLATEICRLIRKVYGVRNAEVSSMIERDK